MTSDPIISWQIDGETMETVTGFIYFIFLGSKITADGAAAIKLYITPQYLPVCPSSDLYNH